MVTMYNYDRNKTAKYNFTAPYYNALSSLQENFVGHIGVGVASYINTLNRRLGRTGDWTYGAARERGTQTYSMTVYNVMESTPGVVEIVVRFDKAIEVVATTDSSDRLLNKKLDFGRSASGISLLIGEAWEKLTTGNVNYGD